MRYFVFATEAEAQAAVASVDSYARVAYYGAGYSIAQNGDVIGKANGVDNPAGVTRTWDIPRQRATDSKWVFLHPENHPMADYEVAPGVTVKVYTTQDISAPIEEEATDWWPVVEEPI